MTRVQVSGRTPLKHKKGLSYFIDRQSRRSAGVSLSSQRLHEGGIVLRVKAHVLVNLLFDLLGRVLVVVLLVSGHGLLGTQTDVLSCQQQPKPPLWQEF